jgi:undecaprenyl pyrophosphate phosphatase UppP
MVAGPPRGWLKGVLVTILVFWYSGLVWESFRANELPPAKLIGSLLMIGGLALTAHEALTNDDYKTSKATSIARTVFFIGLAISLVARQVIN